ALERGLLEHLRQFLIELGMGFAFVGSQVPLEVGGEDFKLDLLFYHLKLRCFCVIDLKMTPFKPEYAGKMNFYLSAVDESAPPSRRQAEHRPHSLQDQESDHRGVRSEKSSDAHGNL